MYSVVLMMALTSGGDVPALGHGCRGGCYGCYGCYGGCHGCYGGCHGRRGGHHRRHGCCGGCYGCYGCGGGCFGGCYGYGCCGGHRHHRRHHGCCGGCYGGCYGCGGGCYGAGCFGCVGGVGGVGGVGAPVVPGKVVPTTPAKPEPSKKTSFDSTAPATLIVSVPADAQLRIDGEATTSTSAERVFVSPALQFGREYTYTLEAEFHKDGKLVKVRKNVPVKAGDATRVNFDADRLAEVASR